jgi:hypothetical protein
MLGRFSVELLVDAATNTVCVRLYVANALMLLQQVVRVVHDVLEQRFVSLKYELLTPFEDVVVQVRVKQRRDVLPFNSLLVSTRRCSTCRISSSSLARPT